MGHIDRRSFLGMVPVGMVGLSALASCTPYAPAESTGGEMLGNLRQLRIMVFPGGFNLPMWSAQENGFFADRGIDLTISETRSSVQQITALMEGTQDLALTAMDNVVAYQAGQGAIEFDTPTDLFAFMGGDNAFLRLVVQPDITTYEDLRGKTLSVDALTTGFAFVLKHMLAANGLEEGDYELVSAGGVMQRFQKLQAGEHAGTLLLTPFELMAESAGLRTLQSAIDTIPAYQGIVGAARRSWAAANPGLLVDFISAYRKGLAWLFDPANRVAADELLAQKLPNLPGPIRQETLAIFLDPETGFEPRAMLDAEGVRQVMDIRSRFAEGTTQLDDASQYYNLEYYNRAAP